MNSQREFYLQQYRDNDTGRYRWAVLQVPSNVWYFPKHYGKLAAIRLLNRLLMSTLCGDSNGR